MTLNITIDREHIGNDRETVIKIENTDTSNISNVQLNVADTT
jgi:hypothetical protein